MYPAVVCNMVCINGEIPLDKGIEESTPYHKHSVRITIILFHVFTFPNFKLWAAMWCGDVQCPRRSVPISTLHTDIIPGYVSPDAFCPIMTSSNGNTVFPRYWPSVRRTTSDRRIPLAKASGGALKFYLICAWTSAWANNRDIGDFGTP